MATINYENKEAVSEFPSIPAKNKFTDDDANLIKTVGNQILTTLGVYTDDWSSSATYLIDDVVVYDNRYFKNLTGTNTATTPDEDTTNWLEVSIRDISGGAEIPIQDTAPVNPRDDDLWIDTSDNAMSGANVLNEYSTSNQDVYSCDYVNNKITGTQLWANTSLGAAFGAQTISADLSPYKYIELVYYRFPAATTPMFRIFTRVGDTSQLNYCDYDQSTVRAWIRQFEVKSTGIEFKNATINGTTDNSGLVPGKIIGHK